MEFKTDMTTEKLFEWVKLNTRISPENMEKYLPNFHEHHIDSKAFLMLDLPMMRRLLTLNGKYIIKDLICILALLSKQKREIDFQK
jgi:hypothetical protein